MLTLLLATLRDLLRPHRDLLLENIALRLVKPETVISRHSQGSRLFWRWKSKPKDYGRSNVPFEVREATVAKYMVRRRGRPTQNWKTFLDNHLGEIIAIDFLTVPTVTFKNLYVFLVLNRTHLGLEKATPAGRLIEPPEHGPVKRRAAVGGLHSRYYREAA